MPAVRMHQEEAELFRYFIPGEPIQCFNQQHRPWLHLAHLDCLDEGSQGALLEVSAAKARNPFVS